MTDQPPGHNAHVPTDIPEPTRREDGVESELSDQDLEDVSGGTISFQPPHNGVPGNPV